MAVEHIAKHRPQPAEVQAEKTGQPLSAFQRIIYNMYVAGTSRENIVDADTALEKNRGAIIEIFKDTLKK